jgi:hypothetical protein
MGARRIRREQRQFDMAKSRRENGMVKMKERERRAARMVEIIKKGKPVGEIKMGQLPYTPAIISWLSAELDKPARQIGADDVRRVLEKHGGA